MDKSAEELFAEAKKYEGQGDKRSAPTGWNPVKSLVNWVKDASVGESEHYEEAAKLFERSAAAYRRQMKYENAGEAYERAGRNSEKAVGMEFTTGLYFRDAYRQYIEAFKAYSSERNNTERAAKCLDCAIRNNDAAVNAFWKSNSSTISQAADSKKELAAVLEDIDLKRAMEAYELAASWYTDKQSATASPVWERVGDLAAILSDHYKAIKCYERANVSQSFSLRVPLKAIMCHLATKDTVTTQRALDKYRESHPTLARSREHQLLVGMMQALEAGDHNLFPDQLAAEVFASHSMNVVADSSKLPRKTGSEAMKILCQQIRDQIVEADNEFS